MKHLILLLLTFSVGHVSAQRMECRPKLIYAAYNKIMIDAQALYSCELSSQFSDLLPLGASAEFTRDVPAAKFPTGTELQVWQMNAELTCPTLWPGALIHGKPFGSEGARILRDRVFVYATSDCEIVTVKRDRKAMWLGCYGGCGDGEYAPLNETVLQNAYLPNGKDLLAHIRAESAPRK
jgi:hypothetical protein